MTTRRILRAATAGVFSTAAVAVLLVTGARPAAADGEQAPITLAPGSTVVVKGAAQSAPGYALSRAVDTSQTPENCRDLPPVTAYCDSYPIKLSLPPSTKIEDYDAPVAGGDPVPKKMAYSLVLSATIDYAPGALLATLPHVNNPAASTPEGPIYEHMTTVRIYYSPQDTTSDEGDDGGGLGYAAGTPFAGTPPQSIAVVGLDVSRPLYATVACYFTVSCSDYTLTLRLEDVNEGFTPPVDLGAIPEDFSAGGNDVPVVDVPADMFVPLAPTDVLTSTPVTAPAAGLPNFNGGGLDLKPGEGASLASALGGQSSPPLPPYGSSSWSLAVVWLLVIPAMVSGFYGGLWRKRRQSDAA